MQDAGSDVAMASGHSRLEAGPRQLSVMTYKDKCGRTQHVVGCFGKGAKAVWYARAVLVGGKLLRGPPPIAPTRQPTIADGHEAQLLLVRGSC